MPHFFSAYYAPFQLLFANRSNLHDEPAVSACPATPHIFLQPDQLLHPLGPANPIPIIGTGFVYVNPWDAGARREREDALFRF